MSHKKSSNSKKTEPDDNNAILRTLELRAIAMLTSTLIEAMDRLDNNDAGDIDLPNTLLDIVNSVEYGNNPQQQREHIEIMIGNLKGNIKRSDDKLGRGGKNDFFANNKDRAYEFMSEMVCGIVDSTAVLADNYTKDDTKMRGSNHHLEVQITFNGDVWVFEFADLNTDESIKPNFFHAGGVMIKTTINGRYLIDESEQFSASVLSLLALAIKKEKQKLHEIEEYKSDARLVIKAKELAKIVGGDYNDHLVFLRRIVDAVIFGDSQDMSIDEVENTIRSILQEELSINSGSIQAIIDMLSIGVSLDSEPKAGNLYH